MQLMPAPITGSVYLKRLKAVHHGKIIPVDTYLNLTSYIRHKCQECGHIWKVPPTRLCGGHGCPKCAHKNVPLRYTNEQYKALFKTGVNSNIVPLEEYKGINKHLLHKCKICNHQWMVTPRRFLDKRKAGCVKCQRAASKSNQPKTHEMYVAELKQKNIGIFPLEKYIKTLTQIKHQCKNGHKFKISPSYVLSGGDNTCRECNLNLYTKHHSKLSGEWLNELKQTLKLRIKDASYKTGELYIFIENHKQWLDGYNKMYNIAFEFLGDFWHGKSTRRPKKDNIERLEYTREKINRLLRAGYAVVFTWESDYLDKKKATMLVPFNKSSWKKLANQGNFNYRIRQFS